MRELKWLELIIVAMAQLNEIYFDRLSFLNSKHKKALIFKLGPKR